MIEVLRMYKKFASKRMMCLKLALSVTNRLYIY